MITLDQLLQSRDIRSARQSDWVKDNPGLVLVCLTVILPGPVKRDHRSLKVAQAGVAAIRETLHPVKEECFDLETGFEAFFLVPEDPLECKLKCCGIEDGHPLGRLMDIDVLESSERSAVPVMDIDVLESSRQFAVPVMDIDAMEPSRPFAVPVGRDRIGRPGRLCLLCGQPARECMRARTHSLEELQRRIDRIVEAA